MTVGMEKEEPLGCLGWILKLFNLAPNSTSKALPYKRKDWLLSRAERSFFGVLFGAVGSDYLVFSKIRLADLIFIPRGTEVP